MNNIIICDIKKHPLDFNLLSKYKFVIRRLPCFITEESVKELFTNVKDIFIYKKDTESIAYLDIDDDYAEELYNILNGNVLSLDNYWYPIEVVYYKNKDKKELKFSTPYKQDTYINTYINTGITNDITKQKNKKANSLKKSVEQTLLNYYYSYYNNPNYIEYYNNYQQYITNNQVLNQDLFQNINKLNN